MRERKLPATALALRYLRAESGWTKEKLAAAVGISDARLILRYERGDKPLSREYLDHLVAPLGRPPEAVDALLFVHTLVAPESREEPASPVAPSPEERTTIVRAAVTAGWTTAEEVQRLLERRRRKRKVRRDRKQANALWERVKLGTWEERRDLVRIFPAFWNWALVERICQESIRASAHRVRDALALADLALFLAEQCPGDERWRSRLLAFCWAHVANARRVANEFDAADEAFTRAWALWRAGEGSDSNLLPEWRMLDLEASLRRAQHRFPEALHLLDRALSLVRGAPGASGRVLLNKESLLERMGDIEGALKTVSEAIPLVERSGDPRLLFALRFKIVNHLCYLGRFTEASKALPLVREMAIEQANELDLIRVLWLESKVSAGQGRSEEAMAALNQVRDEFSARHLPYEAALASLELALLWLQAGRLAEVRELARGMSWIFATKKIRREALAAIRLFCEAASQERATLELAQAAIQELQSSSPASAAKNP
jgi:transcriptional regulator with XRE-family HTH domain/tetratricopeptide (TPR) repeat protein